MKEKYPTPNKNEKNPARSWEACLLTERGPFNQFPPRKLFTSNTCHTRKKKLSSVRDLFTSFEAQFFFCSVFDQSGLQFGPVHTEERKRKTKRRLFQQIDCIALSRRKVADVRENVNSRTCSLSVNVNVPKTKFPQNLGRWHLQMTLNQSVNAGSAVLRSLKFYHLQKNLFELFALTGKRDSKRWAWELVPKSHHCETFTTSNCCGCLPLLNRNETFKILKGHSWLVVKRDVAYNFVFTQCEETLKKHSETQTSVRPVLETIRFIDQFFLRQETLERRRYWLVYEHIEIDFIAGFLIVEGDLD